MTTHRLDKNVSGKCSAKPHMSQGCQRSRSDSPQLVNSMRRRQWRRTHKHTFPVYVIGLMTWFAWQQSVYFLHDFYIFIKWDIFIADISIMLIYMMDISTVHISIVDTSKMVYLGYIQFKLDISCMDVSMDISMILIYICKDRYTFYWICS